MSTLAVTNQETSVRSKDSLDPVLDQLGEALRDAIAGAAVRGALTRKNELTLEQMALQAYLAYTVACSIGSACAPEEVRDQLSSSFEDQQSKDAEKLGAAVSSKTSPESFEEEMTSFAYDAGSDEFGIDPSTDLSSISVGFSALCSPSIASILASLRQI